MNTITTAGGPQVLQDFRRVLSLLGHFAFEKNKPASFKRPLYSILGDWAMYSDIWRGKIAL